MKKTRVHILTAVNAAAVRKEGDTYTILGVCGAVDGIVMNSALYPAAALAAGIASLEGKPAPAGHPKNAAGQFISALNGEALASAWIGSYCRNARHEGGRSQVDVVVNAKQAMAHPDRARLVERLEAAINGSNVEPIDVSTGLMCRMLEVNGESRGKKYTKVASDIAYDHLAILLNEQGAGTPEEGVGMFLNAEGAEEAIEVATLNSDPEDKRHAGLLGRLRKLLGNASDISFDQIRDGLYGGLPEGAWVVEVYQRYAVWCDRDGKLWQQDYTVSSEGSVAFSGSPVEVIRRVAYEPVSNHEEADTVKEQILAALNAAGIKTEGLDEAAFLVAYNALVTKPVGEQLAAANAQLQAQADAQRQAQEAEARELAKKLATNTAGGLGEDDLVKLGVERLRQLTANSTTAAPVVAGPAGTRADEFATYSINAVIDKKEA
jgi:predicted nucleotidyltransferase